jgi:glycosyltransferase involved in cell wall biosynthesis
MASNIYILQIAPGPVPPPLPSDPCPFQGVNPRIQIDVLQACWGNRNSSAPAKYNRANVRYHFTYNSKQPALLKVMWYIAFCVTAGTRIYLSGRRFKAIVSYGPTTTALAGLLLKWITGAKLIVEFVGDPRTAYLADSERPTRTDRLKYHLAQYWIRFLLRWTDRVKILFPGQVDIYPEARTVPQTVYPAHVAVNSVPQGRADGRYVLLLGFPWYLKGADILIKAFRRVASEFPDYKLKIVGHCPDRGPYEELRGDCERIEFHPGVHRQEALELVACCTILVLPSRTESMGRVIIEAMAARKPVIASCVGGIPHYVEAGRTGLLFESENVEQLASCLRQLLSDESLRRRLGAAGQAEAFARFGEKANGRYFSEMIFNTI